MLRKDVLQKQEKKGYNHSVGKRKITVQNSEPVLEKHAY